MTERNRWLWIYCGVAALALGCSDDPTAVLIAQLNDPDPQVRRSAVRALSQHEGELVVAALAGATDDEDVDIRRLAISDLGRRGSQAADHASFVVSALDDSQLSVRLAAAWALQSIDTENEAFVPILTDALLAGEGVVFLDVADMGPRAGWATPTLIRLLSHTDPKIRALAARTLGSLKSTSARVEPALRRALRDSHEAVREAAKQSLEQLP